MSDAIRCLVTGATGYIGGRLVPLLLHRGRAVRALARDPAKLGDVGWRGDVEVARGDLGDTESLSAAFDGMDVVYYLVHSMGTSSDFVAEEARSARNVVEAARRAGVRRLVYLGGLHPSGVELSPHLRSRTAVGDILIESGVETVVLQAGVVIGSGSASFELIRHLTNRLPAMTAPKWVHNKVQPIAIDDVLHYLAEAADTAVPTSRTWDIGGPDVLEYGEAMQVYAEVAGLRRRLIVVLPWLTPSIASWWIGLVTPMPAGLARPLVESLECDATASEHDIDSVIAPPPGGLTGYRDAVARALEIGPLPSDPRWAHVGRP
ncbi:NAD(P)H-binding protein [Mycolicibacterium pulveris]|uniref:NAD(P)H-binding protein n=1 Tax=Mycolicibacterium pulveris TaxID=36813 RepID=UPI0013D5739A|nr:NAD(P)H-binding protein [Mycolicibacterium pulveris]MCV6980462.1 NAD(P)H-binding protein [Mycolicibacterium pulveris]